MTDEDMFETMDRILGETEIEVDHLKNSILKFETSTNSKPSHPLWKLIDQWGGKLCLSADQLELWEGEP